MSISLHAEQLQEEEFWHRFGAKLEAIQRRHQLNLGVQGYASPVLSDVTSKANNVSHVYEAPGKVSMP